MLNSLPIPVNVSLCVLNISKAVNTVVTTPETCSKWSPVIYPPIARATERVKFTWSSACHFFNTLPPTYPIMLPRATAP